MNEAPSQLLVTHKQDSASAATSSQADSVTGARYVLCYSYFVVPHSNDQEILQAVFYMYFLDLCVTTMNRTSECSLNIYVFIVLWAHPTNRLWVMSVLICGIELSNDTPSNEGVKYDKE